MLKTWIEGRLGYNSENDRYGLLVSDLWRHNFSCGERLQVQIDGKWIDTRIEMDWSTSDDGIWYLVGTDIKGDDLEYVKARI